MYQFMFGAGALVLFSFSAYTSSGSDGEAVTNNYNSSKNKIDDILSLIENNRTEKQFNRLRNELARAVNFLEENPNTKLSETVWRIKTSKNSVFDAVRSLLINSKGYTETDQLENILHSASPSYISSLAKGHIDELIQRGCAKEAYVLHNIFFLLNKTVQRSNCELNSQDLAVPLAWMGKWLGFPDPRTKAALKNQTEAMMKILPCIIMNPAFKHDFNTCLENAIYQTKKESRRNRMS